MVGVGLIGFGYWGPNLARNFSGLPDCRLVAICDLDSQRMALAARNYPLCQVTANYDELLTNPEIQAVVIATPVSSHFDLARRALLAGKDVLLEKPISQTIAQAREMLALARDKNLILAVDHTFLFTGAVQKIKQIVAAGELGEVLYFDSVRVNLGLFQHDVNVIFDLAPHDVSIICYLVDEDPLWVQAMGSRHASPGLESLAYLHMEYPNGMVAHIHVNWLAPVKIRRTLIGGTAKMIVYDDLESSEKVKLYDKGVIVTKLDRESAAALQWDYRTGDMVAPKLAHREALRAEAEHFVQCVSQRTQPLVPGEMGLRVLRVLQAANLSLARQGGRVAMDEVE